MVEREAAASWEGSLFEGHGVVSAVTSGLFSEAPVTWASRTEAPGGRTSPEELIAAAHAACFSMALSNELSSRSGPPVRLEVKATSGFADGVITRMVLDVSATLAPGVDEAAFREALAAAEGSCPVSNALRGTVAIEVRASVA